MTNWKSAIPRARIENCWNDGGISAVPRLQHEVNNNGRGRGLVDDAGHQNKIPVCSIEVIRFTPCFPRLQTSDFWLFALCSTPFVAVDGNHASRYYCLVIKTFKCVDTRALSKGDRVRRFVNIAAVARRKLRQLEIAARLADLRVPPGNRLEALRGDREGQYSIRINDQFRLCFRWTETGAEDVEIVDYH